MQLAEHPPGGCVGAVCSLGGVVGGVAGDEAEDVASVVVDAEVAGRVGVADGLQMGQDSGSERGTGVARAAHRLAGPYHFAGRCFRQGEAPRSQQPW